MAAAAGGSSSALSSPLRTVVELMEFIQRYQTAEDQTLQREEEAEGEREAEAAAAAASLSSSSTSARSRRRSAPAAAAAASPARHTKAYYQRQVQRIRQRLSGEAAAAQQTEQSAQPCTPARRLRRRRTAHDGAAVGEDGRTSAPRGKRRKAAERQQEEEEEEQQQQEAAAAATPVRKRPRSVVQSEEQEAAASASGKRARAAERSEDRQRAAGEAQQHGFMDSSLLDELKPPPRTPASASSSSTRPTVNVFQQAEAEARALQSLPVAASQQQRGEEAGSGVASSLLHRLAPYLTSFFETPPASSAGGLPPSSPRRQRAAASSSPSSPTRQQAGASINFEAELQRVRQELEAERQRRMQAQQLLEQEREQHRRQQQQQQPQQRRETTPQKPMQPLLQPPQPPQPPQPRPSPAIARQRLADVRRPAIGRCARLVSNCRAAAVFSLRLMLLLSLLLAAAFIAQQRPALLRALGWEEQQTVFCPSAGGAPSSALVTAGSLPPCTPCPAHGVCDAGGRLQCDSGFIAQALHCVKDTELLRGALRFRQRAVQQLQEQRGRADCGAEQRRWLTGSELSERADWALPWWRSLLRPAAEEDVQRLREQFLYALRLLREDSREVEVDEPELADDSEDGQPPDAPEAISRSPSAASSGQRGLRSRYTAVTGSRPLLCQLRLTAYEHAGQLLLLALLWSALSYLYWRWQRERWRGSAHRRLLEAVRAELRRRANEPVAIDHLRDELWFKQDEVVWQRVVADMDADARVTATRAQLGHLFRECWLWVDQSAAAQRRPQQAQQAQQPPQPLPAASPAPSAPPTLASTQPSTAASAYDREAALPSPAYSLHKASQPPAAASAATHARHRGCCIC